MIEPTKQDLFREVTVASKASGVLVGFSGPVVMVLLDEGQWPTSVNKVTVEWKEPDPPKIVRKHR